MPSMKDIYMNVKNQNKRFCYVQPEVRPSIRPKINYKQPTLPFATDTVHKTSYLPIDPSLAKKCKMNAIRPIVSTNNNRNIKMADATVTSISFQPINCYQRIHPIKQPNCLGRCSEPLSSETTQKHDFVFKKGGRLIPKIPFGNLTNSKTPIDDGTTMRLSYADPGKIIPTKNLKPVAKFETSNVNMNTDTCYKLSFQPVETKKREIPLWAMKPKFIPPFVPFEDTTTQKSSFQPPGRFIEVNENNCNNSYSYSDAYPKAYL